MLAVIFEVFPFDRHRQRYLDIAAQLREQLSSIPGFISIERFQSLTDDKKVLSLSFWENEEAVAAWRKLESHRTAQALGHDELFRDYRICVASVVRDYSINARDEAPADSRASLE
jgi:heme-degrading monooxygenase HmoA